MIATKIVSLRRDYWRFLRPTDKSRQISRQLVAIRGTGLGVLLLENLDFYGG